MGIPREAAHQVEERLHSLFLRFPELAGFSVRGEAEELVVSDIGVSPRLSEEQFGELFQGIAATLTELVEERPEARELLRGRTFARTLH